MIKLIICAGPAEEYIAKSLTSLNSQIHTDWEAVVMVDPCGDRTYEFAKSFESDKIQVHLNDTQMYAMHNIVEGIKLANCSAEDVIGLYDGDDWWYDNLALVHLARHYLDPNVLTSHGSYIDSSNPAVYPVTNSPYLKEESFRESRWRGSHLKAFRYKMWEKIPNSYFRKEDGEYYSVAWDACIMFPALEIAGHDRVKFIPEILYVYNNLNPCNDSKMRELEQVRTFKEIADKTPFHRDDSL